MKLLKERMLLIIHTEGVCWVPLINFTQMLILDWTQRYLSFFIHKHIFLHLGHLGTNIYNRCINTDDEKI